MGRVAVPNSSRGPRARGRHFAPQDAPDLVVGDIRGSSVVALNAGSTPLTQSCSWPTHPFTTVEVTPDERAAGELSAPQLAMRAESLREHGAAIIVGAVDVGSCDLLLRGDDGRDSTMRRRSRPRSTSTGHVQHNPPPRAAHLHADIFANPVAVSIAHALLGLRVQPLAVHRQHDARPHDRRAARALGRAPAVAEPAGAAAGGVAHHQHPARRRRRREWRGSSCGPERTDDVRSGIAPAQGLLVPEDWLNARRAEVPPVRVPVPKGALLLRDGRLWHRGTTNATAHARPMVAMVYTAWWLRPLVIDFYSDAAPVLDEARSTSWPATGMHSTITCGRRTGTSFPSP